MNGERDLIYEIDNVLTNRYVVLEGDDETLYVKDRETGRHFEIKVTQMAKDTGVSASYITGILKGQYYPTLKILKRITSPKGKPQGNVSILDLIYLVDED